jgi:hypothetical protein
MDSGLCLETTFYKYMTVPQFFVDTELCDIWRPPAHATQNRNRRVFYEMLVDLQCKLKYNLSSTGCQVICYVAMLRLEWNLFKIAFAC